MAALLLLVAAPVSAGAWVQLPYNSGWIYFDGIETVTCYRAGIHPVTGVEDQWSEETDICPDDGLRSVMVAGRLLILSRVQLVLDACPEIGCIGSPTGPPEGGGSTP